VSRADARALPGLLSLALGLLPGAARAHEVRPAYLEIRQVAPEAYDVLWKVPARGEQRLGLRLRLPEDCELVGPPTATIAGGAYLERSRVTRRGGLAGGEIRVEGLAATLTDAIARVEPAGGGAQVARLTPDRPSFVVEAAPRGMEVAGTYVALGVEHILLGVDHLLFVLGLLILVSGWRRLVGTVTAFTAAHSITLAVATLGFVRVPGPPVEAAIALSIVFVAAEIVHRRQGRYGLTASWPWIVSFAFGLLHGFGFAGALREIGLPEGAIPLALVFFNVGVELGQLLFIVAVVALLAAARRALPAPRAPRVVALPPSWETASAYAIGGIAAFWLVERTVGFLS
jgi:hydrogenase/urease accessory protein HupE